MVGSLDLLCLLYQDLQLPLCLFLLLLILSLVLVKFQSCIFHLAELSCILVRELRYLYLLLLQCFDRHLVKVRAEAFKLVLVDLVPLQQVYFIEFVNAVDANIIMEYIALQIVIASFLAKTAIKMVDCQPVLVVFLQPT